MNRERSEAAMSNIQMASEELHVAFQHLNKHFFNNQLPEPAITIQSGGKRRSMGWCSSNEIWSDNEGTIQKYEINISAEYLNLEFYETMDTLLHEMVHLYCSVNGIKDASRGGTYHNKRFKAECEQRGFYYPDLQPDKKYGWAFPKLTEEAKKILDTFNLNKDAFRIARMTYGKIEQPEESENAAEEMKKSNSIKWICEECNMTVRSTKVVHIICGDCKQPLIEAV
jgi:rubrerythrin